MLEHCKPAFPLRCRPDRRCLSIIGTAPETGAELFVSEQVKTILCVGLVFLGLALTIPWWGLLGWVAFRLVGAL